MMYGGDEVGAVVLEVGTSMTRAGYSGEDTPQVTISSHVGYSDTGSGKPRVGELALQSSAHNVELKHPLVNSHLTNFDAYTDLAESVFSRDLRTPSSEHPLIFVDQNDSKPEIRKKLTELCFEKFNHPAAFLARSAMLVAFSYGKQSGLVLDSGASHTQAVPVIDGYPLIKNMLTSPIGGDFLTEMLRVEMENNGVEFKPRYSYKKVFEAAPSEAFSRVDLPTDDVTESYKTWAVNDLAKEMKESVLVVPESDELRFTTGQAVNYSLPDGQTITIGASRFRMADTMFSSKHLPPSLSAHQYFPLANMAVTAIEKTHPDVRKELLNNIIISGGNSLFLGFVERFKREVQDIVPNSQKLRFHHSTNVIERRHAAWVGGSILGSLGTFQQLWMSKQEYDEFGADVVERKCP